MSTSHYPRITIAFCTQCKWMLRAAYFAQELMSTFSGTTLGEVALQPGTGGVFVVEIEVQKSKGEGEEEVEIIKRVLWDRKAEGGFPETKELKRRVRDVIEPGRDLGHVDRHGKKDSKEEEEEGSSEVKEETRGGKEDSGVKKCEDCA